MNEQINPSGSSNHWSLDHHHQYNSDPHLHDSRGIHITLGHRGFHFNQQHAILGFGNW